MPFYDNMEDIERAELYRLFASLFINEPQDETVVQLKEIFQMKFADSAQEIRMDFARILLGPDRRLMPYESLYNYPMSSRPRLWGRASEVANIVKESISFNYDALSSKIDGTRKIFIQTANRGKQRGDKPCGLDLCGACHRIRAR